VGAWRRREGGQGALFSQNEQGFCPARTDRGSVHTWHVAELQLRKFCSVARRGTGTREGKGSSAKTGLTGISSANAWENERGPDAGVEAVREQ